MIHLLTPKRIMWLEKIAKDTAYNSVSFEL